MTVAPAMLEPQAQRASLRANFAWTLAGNLIYAACQWGMLIVLAKLGSPALVGEFALALALVAPLFLFAGLNTRMVQASDVRQSFRFGEYLGLRLITTLIAFGVLALVLAFEGFSFIILGIALAKWFESISDVLYGSLQKREQMDRIAQAMILKGVGSLAVLGFVFWATQSLAIAVLGMAGVWALVLALFEAPRLGERLWPTWNWPVLGRLALLALPLGIVMFLVSLSQSLPRFFLSRDAGLAEVGIFSALAYLIVAGTTVVNALGQAMTPRLARLWDAGRRAEFFALLGKFQGIVVVLGALGFGLAWILGDVILTWLYRPEYAAYQNVLLWLILAATVSFTGSVLGYGLTAARVFRPQVSQYVVVNLVLLTGCWLWIPTEGMVGAAFALLAANLAQVAIAVGVFVYQTRRAP